MDHNHLVPNPQLLAIHDHPNSLDSQIEFLCVVMPCGVVVGYQRFGGPSTILPQHYTVPQPKDLDLNLHLEDGSSMDL